jgi:hypothetical protein
VNTLVLISFFHFSADMANEGDDETRIIYLVFDILMLACRCSSLTESITANRGLAAGEYIYVVPRSSHIFLSDFNYFKADLWGESESSNPPRLYVTGFSWSP